MATPVTIIGAGLSGLVLGRCLLQNGIPAILFEKSKAPAAINRNNYGITLHAQAYRPLLQTLGLEEKIFRRRVAVDGVGRIDGEAFRANRCSMEKLLAEGLDVRWEKEVKGVKKGEVELVDGEKVGCQVLVGADGVHSQIRKAFVAPGVEFKILPFAVYNGKRKMSKDDFEKTMAAGFDGETAIEQRVASALFQISVNEYSEEGKEVSISYTYSRPAEGKDDPLFRPERPKSGAKDIPDALFQEIDGLRGRLQQPYANIFDSATMKGDRMLHWLMRTLRVEQSLLEKAAEDNIVLIGEAAHAEPILGSYGANESIEDAIDLASLLEKRQSGGLRDFIRSREDRWDQGVRESEVRVADMHGVAHPNL